MFEKDNTIKVIRVVVGSDRYVGYAPAGCPLDAMGWSIAKEVAYASATNQVLWGRNGQDRKNLVFNDYADYDYD